MITIIIPKAVSMECAKTSKYPYYEPFEPLKACLDSISKQSYKNYEIIFADWDKRGNFYSLEKSRKKAKGDIILFLCPQAVLKNRDALSTLIKTFNEKGADAVSLSSIANRARMNTFIWLLSIDYEMREDNEGWTDAAPIIYLAIKKKTLDNVGGLIMRKQSIRKNPMFDSGFIDWDFCANLRNSGYKIWHTNKIKLHLLYETGVFGYFKKQFHHAWYRVAYYKKFKVVKEGYSNFSFFYPNIFRLYGKTKDIRVLLTIPLFAIRDFSWALGFIKGAWDFYFKGKLKVR